MQEAESSNWVIEETKTANFSDQRLNKRLSTLLNSLSDCPNKSIPMACKGWKESIAAYRFFNHPEINYTDILMPHKEATLNRIKKEKIVLIPQDTTEIDFCGRKPIKGMGFLSSEKSQGFYLHPSIAFTPEKLCLGVTDIYTYVRKTLRSKKSRKTPIEEKETYCWLKGYEAANEVAKSAPETTIISIADRGGDICEFLQKTRSESNKAYWLIRSRHDRNIVDENTKVIMQLNEKVKKLDPVGEIKFEMSEGRIYHNKESKRRPRTPRTVTQEIRICTAYIKPPMGKRNKASPIPVNIIHCKEVNAPNEEERIEWTLLTSFPVNNAESAIEIVNWYLCRWQIEIFFKILKSGCTVEELQFDTLKATINCIAIYHIVAWRILYLTILGRRCPDIDCSIVFEDSEWKSVYIIVNKKAPPQKPPALNEMITMVAKLGGFLARKSDGYPGAKTMWIGMQRMKDFTLAWEAFHGEETYV